MQRAARPGCVARRISHLQASSTAWLAFVLSAILSFSTAPVRAGGIVTNCTEADLRAALAGGGMVTFACDGMITLTNTLTIDQDATLDGTGRNVVLSGGNAVRVFQVNPGVRLTLINLTIANGRHAGTNGAPPESAFGGAIYSNGGTVNLLNCTLTNNSAKGGDASYFAAGAARGGAIFNEGGTLNITNTLLSGNSTIGGTGASLGIGPNYFPAGDAFGGAIFNSTGRVNVAGSIFSLNTATGGVPGGGILYFGPGSGFGGAVHSTGGELVATNCAFVANRTAGASSPSSAFVNGSGGEGHGGALSLSNGLLVCLQSAFITNVASGGSGSRYGNSGNGLGGAIFKAGSAAFRDCTLSNNAAIGGGGGIENGLGLGGGIYSVGTLEISSSSLAGNAAVGLRSGGSAHGGVSGSGFGAGIFNTGILTVTNSTVFGNRAEGGEGSGFSIGPGAGSGGGLFNVTGIVHIVNSTLSANVARNGGTNIGSFLPGRAGGIFSTNGTVTLWNTIVANSGSGSNCFGTLIDGGGNLSSDGSCKFTAPGSLNNIDPLLGPLGDYGGPTPTVPLLIGSPALDAANAAYCPLTDQRGVARPFGAACDIGAFESQAVVIATCVESDLANALAGGGSVTFACDGTITLTNTLVIDRDTTLDGSGHNVVLSGDNAVRAFQVNPGVRLTLINLTIANGRHTGTNATNFAGAGGPGFGGGIYNQSGIVTLLNCALTNNLARGGNGGSGAGQAGPAFGGGVFNDGGLLAITNGVFGQNTAYAGSAGPTLVGVQPPASGDGFGGGIYSRDGIVFVESSRFRENTASSGTGLSWAFVNAGPWGSAFGGAIHVEGGSLNVDRCLFEANSVVRGELPVPPQSIRAYLEWGSYSGGAISVSNAGFICVGSTFVTNQASFGSGGGGGGALATAGETELVDCVLRGNRAFAGRGGALYNLGNLRLRGSVISGNVVIGSEGKGGGIFNQDSMTISGCTLTENVALGNDGFGVIFGGSGSTTGHGLGGGIYNLGDLSMTNSTLFANRAVGGSQVPGSIPLAAGLARGGGFFQAGGSAVLVHVTVSSTNAASGQAAITAPAFGGGIFSTNGTVTLWNSIVANSGSGSNCFGTLIDGGHNLSSDGSCNFTAPGSLNNTDPLLGSLGDYGGPTPTVPLLAGSPALDTANATSCPPTDQRGVVRPYGTACDIGAFEWTPYLPNAFAVEPVGPGVTRLVFAGMPNQNYQLLVSTNLPVWWPLTTIMTDASGIFRYVATNDGTRTCLFFKAAKP